MCVVAKNNNTGVVMPYANSSLTNYPCAYKSLCKMGDVAMDKSETWTRVRKFIAGYVSGACLVLAGHPFDTIKVRMQSEGAASKRFNGVVDCVAKTVRHEGVRGLYKGMAAPLAMTGGINSILFGTQFNIVSEFVKQRGGTPGQDKPTLQETMKAAVISGAFISIFVTPMEGVKARLQVQYNANKSDAALKSKGLNHYTGPIDCAKVVSKCRYVKGDIPRLANGDNFSHV